MLQRLRDQIWPSMRDAAVAIEHVGSTSITGMAAKPVIDVDIVIASGTDLPEARVRLKTLGYKHRGNLGIDDREAFAPSMINRPTTSMCACRIALHFETTLQCGTIFERIDLRPWPIPP